MKNKLVSRIGSLVVLLAGIGLLSGCLFAPAIKSARSLPSGERSMRYTGVYWQVETTRHSQPTPTPSPTPYYYYSYTPIHTTSTARFWDLGVDLRMGTLLDGLDMGLAINAAGAVTGDLNYQFWGFNSEPKSWAASVGAQLSALAIGGYGMAGDLTLTDRVGGIADLSIGGRFGSINSTLDNSNSSYSSSYSSDSNNGYFNPASYNYADLYAGAELFFLERVSVNIGFAMRQILGGPFANYKDYNDNTVLVTYPAAYYFTVSLRTYHGGRFAAKAAKEARAKRAERLRRLRAMDEEMDSPASTPAPEAAPAAPVDMSLYDQIQREAKLEVSKGNFAAGLAKFKATEAFKAPDYTTLMNEGYCHYMLKNWPEAQEVYEKALQIEPSNDRLRTTVENLRKKNNPAQPEEAP